MAIPVKIPANIGPASPGGPANTGLYNPIYPVAFAVSGLAAAITALPIFTAPTSCTVVGLTTGLQAPGTTITFVVKKVTVAAQTATDIASTDAVVTSTATGNPVWQQVITLNGVASTVQTGSGTGMTAPVLKTDGTCTLVQGDILTLTTSGTFTSSNNLFVTVWVRDDSGAI